MEARIEWAFQQALNRKPATAERQILPELYQKSLRQFTTGPTGAHELIRTGEAPLHKTVKATDLAALTVVTSTILNLQETITRNSLRSLAVETPGHG